MKKTTSQLTRLLRRPLALLLACAMTMGMGMTAMAAVHDWTDPGSLYGELVNPGDTIRVPRSTTDRKIHFTANQFVAFESKVITLHDELPFTGSGPSEFTVPSLEGAVAREGVSLTGQWRVYEHHPGETELLKFTPMFEAKELELPDDPTSQDIGELPWVSLYCIDSGVILDSGEGGHWWSADIAPDGYKVKINRSSAVADAYGISFTGKISFTNPTVQGLIDLWATTFPGDKQPDPREPVAETLDAQFFYDPNPDGGGWWIERIWSEEAGSYPEDADAGLLIPVKLAGDSPSPSRRSIGGGTSRPFQFSIISSAGEGGSIDPLGEKFYVRGGIRAVYTATPKEGYVVDKVLVDGKPARLNEDNKYVFTDIYGKRTIHVTFKNGSPAPAETTPEGNPATGGPAV